MSPEPVRVDTTWEPMAPHAVADLLARSAGGWWLSGGVALDHWLGRAIRERGNSDVSTTSVRLAGLIDTLPDGFEAWAPAGHDAVVPWGEAAEGADLQPVRIRDRRSGAWVLQVNVEDGTDRAWLYRRDPRLQLPWDRAVIDIEGIPTGAPEVQLLWKALRPRPQDETDKDAVFPKLSREDQAWFEKAILTIHPHSTWSIHVRSPFAPAKASWNRPKA